MIERGVCLLWDSWIIAGTVITSGVISLAYFLIPIVLYTVAIVTNYKIPLTYRNSLILFSCFIALCGGSRLIDILLIWLPWYWFKIVWDAITGAVSMVALAYIYPIAKRALKFVTSGKEDKDV